MPGSSSGATWSILSPGRHDGHHPTSTVLATRCPPHQVTGASLFRIPFDHHSFKNKSIQGCCLCRARLNAYFYYLFRASNCTSGAGSWKSAHTGSPGRRAPLQYAQADFLASWTKPWPKGRPVPPVTSPQREGQRSHGALPEAAQPASCSGVRGRSESS